MRFCNIGRLSLRNFQFSLRKLLEGDWGSGITVCPKIARYRTPVCVKCGSTETHISKCLEKSISWYQHQDRHRDVDGATTRSKSRCLMSINLKEVKIQKISVLCVMTASRLILCNVMCDNISPASPTTAYYG